VQPQTPIETADLAWAFASLCGMLRLPFEQRSFLQQFPPPATPETLPRAAAALGLKLERCEASLRALSQRNSPAIALRRGGNGALRLAVVLCADSRAALLAERDSAPRDVGQAELSASYDGQMLAVSVPERLAEEATRDLATPMFGLGWFVPELLRYRGVWRDVLLASLAMQLIALATPLCAQVVIDKVIVHQASSTLMVIVAALLIFLVFTAALGYARQYLILHAGNRIDGALGTRVFEHLLRLPPRYFESRPTGTLVARLQGVETVREFLTGAAAGVALDLPFVLVFLAIMISYSVPLTLIALTAIGLLALLSLAVTPLLRRRIDRQFLAGARNQAFVTEYVSAMETVKSLQLEPQLAGRFARNLGDYLGASFATRHLANLYGVGAGALEQALAVAVLAAGALLVMTTEGFTIGMLVAFQMFSSRLAQPALRLAGLWQELQQAAVAVRRLADVMDAPVEPCSVRAGHTRRGAAAIEVDNLGFRYSPDSPPVLEGLSLRIAPGACVALIGPSGSGKSTLARLLLGFHLPSGGAIRIDGIDTRHLGANELRLHFGVVPQETRLFSGSLYENLALAQPHAGLAEIVEACRMAEIHEGIEALPRGYQTLIGEHGVGLSGGQKQRVAIARALLRRPRILLCDEATASLDRETAEALGRTITRLRGRVTILFIAHQLPESLRVDLQVRLEARRGNPLHGIADIASPTAARLAG
jgi:subfamily B ATP-binding cassette protein HlyB/CyaB